MHSEIMNYIPPTKRCSQSCSILLAYQFSDMIRRIYSDHSIGWYNSQELLSVEDAESKLRRIINHIQQSANDRLDVSTKRIQELELLLKTQVRD